jgi:hypothetical protein
MPDTYSLSVINSLQGSNLMTKGILAALSSPHPLSVDGSAVSFTEATQRYLFTRLTRKSANAAGIHALAKEAISEGDLQALDRIAAIGAELVEDLDALAELIGLMTIHLPDGAAASA